MWRKLVFRRDVLERGITVWAEVFSLLTESLLRLKLRRGLRGCSNLTAELCDLGLLLLPCLLLLRGDLLLVRGLLLLEVGSIRVDLRGERIERRLTEGRAWR